MKTYVYYSGATRMTAEALMDVLKASGGTSKPEQPVDLVIGWGAKTTKDLKMKTKHSVNHPNCIRQNRNKFNALLAMAEKKVPVPNFVAASNVASELNAKKGKVSLPLIGRTNYHQGGQGFWLCLTSKQVTDAISEGASYFQDYVPVESEYRLHVFKGEVIYAHKKVKHKEPQQAFVNDYLEKMKGIAKANNNEFDESTAKMVLGKMAERKTNSNPVLRSHGEGWQFNTVQKKELDSTKVKDMCKIAVNAVEALDLSFGAVDCAIGEDGKIYVFEVNTAPGLTGKTFDAWAATFKKYIEDLTTKKQEKVVDKKTTSSDKTISSEKVVAKAKSGGSSVREQSIAKIDAIKELLMKSENDVEVQTIMKVASRSMDVETEAGEKMFGA